MTVVIWHGDEQESLELINILRRACTCRTSGGQQRSCASHEMLLDQRVIDGLLFARRIAQRLIVEEFEVAVPSAEQQKRGLSAPLVQT